MGFIGDGFKERDFFIGIAVIVGFILLFAFGKFLIIGLMVAFGIAAGIGIVGYLGKAIGLIKPVRDDGHVDSSKKGGD